MKTDPAANLIIRLKRGERIQAAPLPGPVLADLAALGWSVHRLTGRVIYSVPVPGDRTTQ